MDPLVIDAHVAKVYEAERGPLPPNVFVQKMLPKLPPEQPHQPTPEADSTRDG